MGKFITITASVVLSGLTGCASNLAGIGGESTFHCKAPEGVACQSVSGNYANARVGNLPSQQPTGGTAHGSEHSMETGMQEPAGDGSAASGARLVPTGFSSLPSAPTSGALPLGAIRSDPTVIRIWVAPWEDTDGDLMGETYVHLAIDSGRWLIEHNRQRIKQEFAPVKAPGTATSSAPAAPTASARPGTGDDNDAQADVDALSAGVAQLRNRTDKPGAAQ